MPTSSDYQRVLPGEGHSPCKQDGAGQCVSQGLVHQPSAVAQDDLAGAPAQPPAQPLQPSCASAPGNRGCSYRTSPRGTVCGHAGTRSTRAQGLFSIWGHPCRADAVLRRPTDTALSPGVWPPKSLGCYLPCRCIAAWPGLRRGCSMPNIIQGLQRISRCSVSQEPTAPAAVSTTVGKSLDGTVSPAMLTPPRSWLSLPPPAPAENGSAIPRWGLERWGRGKPAPGRELEGVWVVGWLCGVYS